MKKFIVVAGAVSFLLTNIGFSHADLKEHFTEDFSKEKIKQEFSQTFPNMGKKVEEVEKVKASEVYQVVLDNGFILYYLRTKDGKERYVLLGGLFTTKGENLTDMKKQEFLSKSAGRFIKLVKKEKDREGVIKIGNGKEVNVYAFISSDCPHCRNFYHYIVTKQDKVRAYLFFVDNSGKTRLMLCGKAGVSDVMNGKYDGVSNQDSLLQGCDLTRIDALIWKNFELAKKLNVDGVPFILVENNLTGEKSLVKGADILRLERLINGR